MEKRISEQSDRKRQYCRIDGDEYNGYAPYVVGSGYLRVGWLGRAVARLRRDERGARLRGGERGGGGGAAEEVGEAELRQPLLAADVAHARLVDGELAHAAQALLEPLHCLHAHAHECTVESKRTLRVIASSRSRRLFSVAPQSS